MSTTKEPPIEGEIVDTPTELAVQQIDAITMAEIDIAISTAKKYPRQIAVFKDRIMSMATGDRETAAGCYYSLRRSGKTIQGPSIRLAEIAIACYGNLRAGTRFLGETADGKLVRVMGVCHDLEMNTYIALEVTRRITNKDGQRYNEDMIATTIGAAGAIALRNAVFKVVPKALCLPSYRAALKLAAGDAKSLTETRERCFERLRSLSPLITKEAILAAVGRPSIEEVTVDDVQHLIGLGTAIHEGQTPVEEAFPTLAAGAAGATTAADILNGKAAAQAGAATEADAPGTPVFEVKDASASPPEATPAAEQAPTQVTPQVRAPDAPAPGEATLPPEAAARLTEAAKKAKVPSAALAKHLGVALIDGEADYAWLARLPLAVGQSPTDCELELTRAIQAQARLLGRRG